MLKAYSNDALRAHSLDRKDRLPRMTIFLKKKHSTVRKQDIKLPIMSQKLKDRLIQIDRVPRQSIISLPQNDKYRLMYTPQKIKSLLISFFPLYNQFRQLTQILRRKLYQRLPVYLFNVQLISLLHNNTTQSLIMSRLTTYEKIRDFHIIVDYLEKFMTESRRRELESREKRLRGVEGIWERGLEQQIMEIQNQYGRLDKVNSFTRKMSQMIGETIFSLQRHSVSKDVYENQEGKGLF